MSEQRLIDANRLIKSIEDNRFTTESVKSLFRITVKAQPTVDAVPVEWIQGFMNRLRDKGQTVCVAVIQGMLEAYCADGERR